MKPDPSPGLREVRGWEGENGLRMGVVVALARLPFLPISDRLSCTTVGSLSRSQVSCPTLPSPIADYFPAFKFPICAPRMMSSPSESCAFSQALSVTPSQSRLLVVTWESQPLTQGQKLFLPTLASTPFPFIP